MYYRISTSLDYLNLETQSNNKRHHRISIISWMFTYIDFTDILLDMKLQLNRLEEIINIKIKVNRSIVDSLLKITYSKIALYSTYIRVYCRSIDFYNLRDDTMGPMCINAIPSPIIFNLFYLIEVARRYADNLNRVNTLRYITSKYIINQLVHRRQNLVNNNDYYTSKIVEHLKYNLSYSKLSQIRSHATMYTRMLKESNAIFTNSLIRRVLFLKHDNRTYNYRITPIHEFCTQFYDLLLVDVIDVFDKYNIESYYRSLCSRVIAKSNREYILFDREHPFRNQYLLYKEGETQADHFIKGIVLPLCLMLTRNEIKYIDVAFDLLTSVAFNNYNCDDIFDCKKILREKLAIRKLNVFDYIY